MIDVIRGGEPLRQQPLAESLEKIRTDDTVARIPAAEVGRHRPCAAPARSAPSR